MKNIRNKKMIAILLAILMLFLSIVLYLTYFQLFKSKKLANHPYNMRNWVDENLIVRGSFLDRNNKLLTHSVKNDEGKSVRVNEYNYLYSSIIGYNSDIYGKSGLESKYNNYLLNIHDSQNIFEKIKEMSMQNGKGNNVKLTIDHDLQSYSYKLLEGHKGAIVVMNVKTGAILSMISRPTFNVNKIESHWEDLISSENSLLLNRASQGLYTPGSIFKVLTGSEILESGIDLSYEDKGFTIVDGYQINNYNKNIYGNIDLRQALVKSSNAYFVDKGMELDKKNFAKRMEKFSFGDNYEFDLPREFSRLPFDKKMSKTQYASALYGQGDTLVTPLDMLVALSSIANDGLTMKPYLVDSIYDEDGNMIRGFSPEELGRSMEENQARIMQDYLKSVVEENYSINVPGISVGGKSGTAENSSGKEHAWYMATMLEESSQYAAIVILESEGASGHTAAPIIENIFRFINN